MFLDFSRSAIFNFNLLPGHRTPNATNSKVRGLDATWVNGLFHEIQSYFSDHRSAIPWLHEHSIYDIFLWFAGYPFGFWLCYKVSPLMPDAGVAVQFLQAALYVYVFLTAMVGLRALFRYGRWVFPISEYRYPRSQSRKLVGRMEERGCTDALIHQECLGSGTFIPVADPLRLDYI
jgi:hypothetical protein